MSMSMPAEIVDYSWFFFLFWFDFMLFRETNERRLTIPIWLSQHFFDHFLNVRRSCCSCCWLRSNEPLAKLGTFARLFIIIITDCFCKSPFGKHFIKIQSISISEKYLRWNFFTASNVIVALISSDFCSAGNFQQSIFSNIELFKSSCLLSL